MRINKTKSSIILEAKADDEYVKNYSNIEREIFDKIVLADPFTRVLNNEIQTIGPNAKQLLLPKYEKESDFILNNLDEIKSTLQTYMDNRRNYPVELRNISNFNSVEEFVNFVKNPESVKVEVSQKEEINPLDDVYNKYYSDIDKEIFDKIIKLDPETTDKKIGDVAKNLLLPKYKKGDRDFLNRELEIKNAIEIFNEDKVKYPSEKQSVQNYESIDEFVKFVTEGPDSNLVQTLKNNKNIEGEFKVLTSTRDYDIIQPLSNPANTAIGGGYQNPNGMHWCTSDEGNDHYWNSYTSNNNTLYCIMHKTKNRGNENRTLNWQFQLDSNNQLVQFLDGRDAHTYDNDPSKDFSIFLNSHPEILLKMKDVEPFKNVKEVINAADNLKYANGPLVIDSNKDLLKLFDKDNYVILRGIVKELVINNISKIPSRLFYDFDNLRKITIGPAIKIISNQCFKDCGNLREVNLAEGLEIIEAEAFMGCLSLKKLRLPNSVKEIKERAFADTSCRIGIQIDRLQSNSVLKLPKSEEMWYIKHLDAKKS